MIAQWAGMFLTLGLLDFVYGRWTLSITNLQPVRASLWAALCYGLTGIATVQYVGDPLLLIPGVAGCMAGSYLSVKLGRKL